MDIGRSITHFREVKKITPAKLAELTGLSQSSISMYENNKRNPSEQALEKIADALDITVRSLYERAKKFEKKEKSTIGYIQEIRRLERIRETNDIVTEINNHLILAINIKLIDLNNDSFTNGFRRPSLPTSIEAIFGNVIKGFLRVHADELLGRIQEELDYVNFSANDIADAFSKRDDDV